MFLELAVPDGSISPNARAAPDASRLLALPRLREMLSAAPYLGRVEVVSCDLFAFRLGLGAIVCVPACNEEVLLPSCLEALGTALRAADAGAVIVVNNSCDASAEIVRRWAATAGAPVVCCEVRLSPPADTVAIARRLALDLAEASASRDAVLLSTDADTQVPADWIVRMAALIRGGAALVSAGITVDEEEASALPPAVRRAGRVESELAQAYQAIWERLVAPEPCALLIAAGGANMAVGARAYRAVGCLPTNQRNEDRALTEAILAAGLPVRVDRSIAVVTSLRTEARAPHGMADAIARRCRDPDPPVDGLLVPFALFLERALAHAAGTGTLLRGADRPLRLSEASSALTAARTYLAHLETAHAGLPIDIARATLAAGGPAHG
ncbi:glycosyltransferase family 2 protein [Acuticoccus sp. I52.16.1]|uniref:glycosyltransferase n=1 Tax=Acuticoccus sp. I52.16.1 TaxID=2928472 RepID=UPI001FD2C3CD|nr:glycosyltransferase [Acuticoccus sp. I52.16.1]UOM36540.1 glycosyltransferase [Acuticoccus sp. I52.16.1]